ncbi:class I SAM-dependent methyltransferase [Ferroacidibacillus organovorans]|nr:methyltransferase domain-containing protein [Ferroacidibacillus organovorans]KYP80064.1 hypothetical protein AYJ22_12670 [Ferroacidibacillus organovorans]KYP82095.1 hypothetical protein AYJ22_00070 [Ferroacidibacillus organovorans]OAG93080.1 hypothetical protein AYW79_12430 [Ferroacidibacillus organovorans]OAG93575.1 hypothetical protein AYW79_09800 [Ferroacidibacillus organovorans]
MGHRFDPAHVDRLLSAERMKLLPPDETLQLLDVRETDDVADIGCGPGYFSLPLAAKTKGSVYCVDLSSVMLSYVQKRAAEANCQNVTTVESPAESIALPDHSVDRILCSFVLHEVDDLSQSLKEFIRILKPSGKMLLIEWEKKESEFGPPIHHRLSSASLGAALTELNVSHQLHHLNPVHYGFLVDSSVVA